MKLRIESDGTPNGTHVFDEAGAELSGVQRVLFIVDVRRPQAHAIVHIAGLHAAEVTLDAEMVEASEAFREVDGGAS